MFRELFLLTVAATLFFGSYAEPQTQPTPTDRVEEDWVLVIGTPSPTEVGPQITTTISPAANNNQNFVAFNLNYRDANPFAAGGLDVRSWNGTTLVTSASDRTEVLSTTSETISWTQQMCVTGGKIVYTICSGQSTTWGAFGSTSGGNGQGTPLTISYTSPAADLSAYSPDYSCSKSNAGWQAQRVSQLKIVQVRYYSQGVLTKTDSTVRNLSPRARRASHGMHRAWMPR